MLAFYLVLPLIAGLAAAQNPCTGDPSITGYCTPLTWDAEPQNDTDPTVDDCGYACRIGVAGDAGDWAADLTGSADGERRRVVGFPCEFAIGRGPGQADPIRFSMANQDILDIYAGVIDRFNSSTGRVAGSGTMTCEGLLIRWWVD
jgi:hypothetical protein